MTIEEAREKKHEFEERAAIAEFDGGFSKRAAHDFALDLVFGGSEARRHEVNIAGGPK